MTDLLPKPEKKNELLFPAELSVQIIKNNDRNVHEISSFEKNKFQLNECRSTLKMNDQSVNMTIEKQVPISNCDSILVSALSGKTPKPILKIPTIPNDKVSFTEKNSKCNRNRPIKRKQNENSSDIGSLKKQKVDESNPGASNDTQDKEKSDGWPSRHRIEYTHEEQSILTTHYKNNHFPNPTEISLIAHRLGIRHKQVIYWFQNRRSKERKDNPKSKFNQC